MNSLVVPIVEGIVEGALHADVPAPAPPSPPPPPPPLPHPPAAPMVAPPNLTQPDALVMMSLVLSIAVPASILAKAAEEYSQGEQIEYSLVPGWLIAAYGFSAAGFAVLFADMKASALTSAHWGFAAIASLCALRHSQRVCDSPRKLSSALSLSIAIVLGVIFAFRTSPRLERCTQTIAVLFVFAAAPACRIYARHRAENSSVDTKIRFARRRQHLLLILMLGMIAFQPWLGVCGPIDPWAESLQMVSDLTILALATDGFW